MKNDEATRKLLAKVVADELLKLVPEVRVSVHVEATEDPKVVTVIVREVEGEVVTRLPM